MNMGSKKILENMLDMLQECFQDLQHKGYLKDVSFQFTVGENVNNIPLNATQDVLSNVANRLQQVLVTCRSETKPVDDSSTISSSHLVQNKGDRNEMYRRISAFIKQKRKEVDELNLQEFCHRPSLEMAVKDSCARVDAVVVKRAGGKRHIKVSQVVNRWGPQTEPMCNLAGAGKMPKPIAHNSIEKSSKTIPADVKFNVDERLGNMETHLGMKTDQPTSKDIYERLKVLEDRILFLEGMSPEYFTLSPRKLHKPSRNFPSVSNKRKHVEMQGDMSLEDIDTRIQLLKNSLKMKQDHKCVL